VLHKALTGVNPAETEETTANLKTLGRISENKKKMRSPLLWRALLAFLNTPADVTIDLLAFAKDLAKLIVGK
jgi:hypothetical protein